MNRFIHVAWVLALAGPVYVTPALAHGEADGAVRSVLKEQVAWGIAGEAVQVTRSVEIRMNDQMRFEPDLLEVRLGETLRLVHHNDGQVMHEFVLGTQQELEQHAELMARFPDMEHDEPYMAHVAPGQRGEIIWTFNRAGDFDFACLIAGHYQAGMRGKVRVLAD
ncbi:cupredoxin domain-containing protein [Pseudomonas xionganensis]|uniref:Plastocyanin n=1 Tax=Pseudomonas xionganensis TaxID=2654845 RepID=A0A6I4L260_9PSED|nr:cupredoxin family protein [Pseudomonas xionganensis]MVW76063.1 plastocyanin [Pseudomonas xionganensis]